MSVRLRTSSGTYNVRHNELVHEKVEVPVRAVKCIVHFLDDTVFTAEIDRRVKAQALLDQVYDHLELIEKDYFGLLYNEDYDDEVHSSGREPKWLDPLKSLKKQFKCDAPYHMHFRVKFYVLDPSRLQEEYTRYHFFLQIKKDILDGKLICPKNVAPLLASYAVQSELGDFSPEEHKPGYLASFTLIPNQDALFEAEVMKFHQQHLGQTPADSEYHYLDRAKHLEMYGVTLHAAKDSSAIDIQLGVTAAGLVVFRNSRKVDTFVWSHIIKISFKRKQFFVQTRRDGGESDAIITFSMFTYRSCKSLWKSCVEHHSFFRLHHIKQLPKKWYQLGSKFRYSGRTEYETRQDSKRLGRLDRPFERTGSKTLRHTVSGSGYNNHRVMTPHNVAAPRPSGSVSNLAPGKPPLRSSFSTRSMAGSEMSAWSSTLPASTRKMDDDEGGFLSAANNGSSRTSLIKRENYASRELQPMTRDHQNRGIVRSHKSMDAINAAAAVAAGHSLGTNSLPRAAALNGSAYQTRLDYSDLPNDNGFLNNHSLVTICMKPDENGRFGFNVKGGIDQGMPIIVSRVAPGMPSDLCVPRLNEGDQVLYINNRDVTQITHEQVVTMIRAARETQHGELVLVVRPNVYVGEDYKEPEFHYVPETHNISTAGVTGLDMLSESILLLREGVESGAAIAQFEQLYRRKPGMTNQYAKMSENLGKNRYRDISPYDQTRVILKNLSAGDYINANFINMEIPGSGIVNRYIAAQGPLPNTGADFWEMVWQQHITFVVMLTALVERGRIKCHQYWPHLYETTDFGTLQLTCLKEKETRSFAFREFTLVNIETHEERHIYQMQYIAWPDHGCPEDSSDFLHFVVRVRQKRIGMVEPTLVHCSAGIGRTGVLILMETAMCLIEANQPVYPLDIVRQMRDQRAMLIQTSHQYRFVCEAILRVYHEGLIRPMEDFHQ